MAKLLGKEWEYIVYNKLDQPLMTQDANQRTGGEWLFTKYDAFGRVVYTGKAVEMDTSVSPAVPKTREEVRDAAAAATVPFVDPSDTAVTIAGDPVFYENEAYPTATLTEVLTINYYDDYDFIPSGMPTTAAPFGITVDTRTTGLATGSRVKVLDTPTDNWITTITFYDHKARPIYTYSNNEYLGTVDILEYELDFTGKPMKAKSSHTRGENTIATLDNFTYDHVGRLLSQTQCIGDETLGDSCPISVSLPVDLVLTGNISTPQQASKSITATNATLLPGAELAISDGSEQELIAYNHYDELGQLRAKKVGGVPGSDYDNTPGLQTIDYKYNVRGWLKTINQDADNADNDLFDFGINYNTVAHGATPLYNGNIAETEWKTQNDNVLRWYGYEYDALNRITAADDNTGSFSVGGISYDKNGNIETLSRQGHLVANPVLGTTGHHGSMDELTYSYDSGNKLLGVSDASGITFGFLDGNTTTIDYNYDGNGNMTSDANKGIIAISYNHMNLPEQVTFGSGNIQYVYDADGTKLKRTISTMGTEILYANGYVYENNTLQFFPHEEGYVTPDGSGGYDYVYQFRDHVNNIRLSYTDADGNGSIDPANEIVEENNYYPFGLKHKGYNEVVSPLGNSFAKKYKYQGQELNEGGLGYNMYEFPLRHYDPALGRFVSTDPYEQFWSPYLAMGNNPVVAFDPDGGNCYDANGNVISCPDSDLYDDYRDNNKNHVTILDGVELTPEDSNSVAENEVETQDNGLRKITPDKFPAITELSGFEHTLAEIELNLTGSRTVTHGNGKAEVDAQGLVLRVPIQGGAGGLEFLRNPASAVKVVTSARSLVKVAQLPLKGKIRFIPRPADVKSGKILKKNGGYVDKFGNVWKKGPSRTKGQAFEWDVQLSAKGKAQLGGLSKDGRHLNISLDGKVTH